MQIKAFYRGGITRVVNVAPDFFIPSVVFDIKTRKMVVKTAEEKAVDLALSLDRHLYRVTLFLNGKELVTRIFHENRPWIKKTIMKMSAKAKKHLVKMKKLYRNQYKGQPFTFRQKWSF